MKLSRFCAFILALLMLLALLSGCGETPEDEAEVNTFRQLYSNEFLTLNYLKMNNDIDLAAGANLIDGLTEFDSYGVVKPALAKSWTSNEDYTVWTFYIKEGIKWVDHNGDIVADVTAQDWVNSARYVNDAHFDSVSQYMYDGIVKNATQYYQQSAEILEAELAVAEGRVDSVEDYYVLNGIDSDVFLTPEDIGVRAVDDYTLEYIMESPCPYFISLVNFAVYWPVYGEYLESMGNNFGIDNETILYNGAYILTDYEPNVTHVFSANEMYWDADNVNIKKLVYTFNADALTLGPTMFKRNEIDETPISADVLDSWLQDEDTKDLCRSSIPLISNSYFFDFNFEPRFDDVYEPENWLLAVNNENFRQSILCGMDRIRALSVSEKYEPEKLLNNTITPSQFISFEGKDYTDFGELSEISSQDSFNESKAIAYKDKAIEELTQAGATFPIKVLMPYDPSVTNWDKECQVIEQQLESLLGKDYIDIIVEAGPSIDFLSAVRRVGKYCLMKCSYAADYADPDSFTLPFSRINMFNFMYTDPNKLVDGKPATNKSKETQDMLSVYYDLVDAAKAECVDINARFEKYAEAESYLIHHAFTIPYSVGFKGYYASYIDPFSGMYSSYGCSPFSYKYVKLLEHPMSMSEYKIAYESWKENYRTAQQAS